MVAFWKGWWLRWWGVGCFWIRAKGLRRFVVVCFGAFGLLWFEVWDGG